MTPPAFTGEVIGHLHTPLEQHRLYGSLRTPDDLRTFMTHHIYSVWDFMSLLKALQGHIAPSTQPWTPRGSAAVRYFINAIVLGEESDEGLPDAHGQPTWASHFELYCTAMREIGADPEPAIHFAEVAAQQGIEAAFALPGTPPAALDFMRSTFGFIATGKPHVIGAAFALGREHIIPEMFRTLLNRMGIAREQAPAFHYYLDRHIHLDEDFHAPLALRMVNELIDGDEIRFAEAQAAAIAAVEARLRFWDGVLGALGR